MPTYRVLYVPTPGARLLIEDVEADTLVQTPVHWVLMRDVLVVGRPRQIVALRAPRRDVTAVLRLCVVSARWGGVLLRRPPDPSADAGIVPYLPEPGCT